MVAGNEQSSASNVQLPLRDQIGVGDAGHRTGFLKVLVES